jgi:hypothetical protein
VIVIEAAVSNKSEKIAFDEGRESSIGHISETGKLQVSSVMLDNLVSSGVVPLPQFVKIDIEGAELLALLGAKQILATSHPTIFLATHGNEVHAECCLLLSSLGYQVQPIDERPLEKSSEILALYIG